MSRLMDGGKRSRDQPRVLPGPPGTYARRVSECAAVFATFYHFFCGPSRTDYHGATPTNTKVGSLHLHSRTDQHERARSDTDQHGIHVSFNLAGRVRDPGGPQPKICFWRVDWSFAGLAGAELRIFRADFLRLFWSWKPSRRGLLLPRHE